MAVTDIGPATAAETSGPPATDPPPTKVPPADAPPPPPLRPRRRFGLGIQSKLLLMLLAVSVLSAAVVGLIGYRSGSDSLRQAAFDRLTEVRESRTAAITSLFDRIKGASIVLTRGTTAVEAVSDFNNGFADLNSRPADPADTAKTDAWYRNSFAPKLAEMTGEVADPQTFAPTSPAQTYLQAKYTVPHGDDYNAALAVDDANDGSSWSAANAKFQDYFRQTVNQLGYDDALLLNTTGDIVYSAYKSPDLGSNVLTGPLNETNLSTAYRAAMRASSPDFVDITDFEFYAPYYGQAVGWALSPIARDGVTVGVLALQLPKEAINSVMTGDEKWIQDGLGTTGETYLAGPDLTMRSISRVLAQNPSEYLTRAVDAATPRSVAEHAVRVHDTILLQPTRTEAVRQALTGRTGTMIDTEYLGQEALVAYAPITVGDLQWVIVAKIDTSEALAPVDDFTRNLMLSTAGIIFVVCLASLLLAQFFSRPVRRLVTGVNRIAAGDLDARVDVNTRDEFGDLATAFNDMGRSLRTKQQLLDDQMAENDRLLHTLMPEQVARRYRDGEQTIAEDHTGVSVIYADVLGYEAFSAGMPSERSLELLNSLVRGFDEAAQRLGIERVRTLREGYLASCGLQVPRVDNERRTVEFALEMAAVVRRFNVQHDASLNIRAGIDTGPVTSGLIGRTNVMYDMWGDAVSLAFRLQDRHGESGIFVTERVRERLVGMQEFAPAGTVPTQDGNQQVFKLQVSTS